MNLPRIDRDRFLTGRSPRYSSAGRSTGNVVRRRGPAGGHFGFGNRRWVPPVFHPATCAAEISHATKPTLLRRRASGTPAATGIAPGHTDPSDDTAATRAASTLKGTLGNRAERARVASSARARTRGRRPPRSLPAFRVVRGSFEALVPRGRRSRSDPASRARRERRRERGARASRFRGSARRRTRWRLETSRGRRLKPPRRRPRSPMPRRIAPRTRPRSSRSAVARRPSSTSSSWRTTRRRWSSSRRCSRAADTRVRARPLSVAVARSRRARGVERRARSLPATRSRRRRRLRRTPMRIPRIELDRRRTRGLFSPRL